MGHQRVSGKRKARAPRMAGRGHTPAFFKNRNLGTDTDEDLGGVREHQHRPVHRLPAAQTGPEWSDDDDFVTTGCVFLPANQGTVWRSPPQRSYKRTARPDDDDDSAPPARHPPRKQYTDRQWILVPNGRTIDLEDLDHFLADLFLQIAVGGGMTRAGTIDRPAVDGSLETLYKCTHKGCPALLCVIKHSPTSTDGRPFASVYKSGNRELQHNDHLEDIKDGIGVPAYVKAVLSPSKLQLQPHKLRSWLRNHHPSIVITADLKEKLANLHNYERKKVLACCVEPLNTHALCSIAHLEPTAHHFTELLAQAPAHRVMHTCSAKVADADDMEVWLRPCHSSIELSSRLEAPSTKTRYMLVASRGSIQLPVRCASYCPLTIFSSMHTVKRVSDCRHTSK